MVGEQISLDADRLNLRRDIFKLCEEASAALQKYFSFKKASDESAKLFELLDRKTNGEGGMFYEAERAYQAYQFNQAKALQAKYDLLLKLKFLDHYTGTPLTL